MESTGCRRRGPCGKSEEMIDHALVRVINVLVASLASDTENHASSTAISIVK